MPSSVIHNKVTKALLGYNIPIVHKALDYSVNYLGYKHRYPTHNAEYLKRIKLLFGKEGEMVAVMHMLQDWGVITEKDCGYKKKKIKENDI